MPTTEVISNGVVQASDVTSKDVNVMTSSEKPNFSQGEKYARDVWTAGIDCRNAVLIVALQNDALAA